MNDMITLRENSFLLNMSFWMVGNAEAPPYENNMVPNDKKNWLASHPLCGTGTLMFSLILSSSNICIIIK